MSKEDFIYGIHTLRTLLSRQPERVLEVWVQDGVHSDRLQPIISLCRQQSISVQFVNKQFFKQQPQAVHQGVCAKIRVAVPCSEGDLFDMLAQLSEPAFLLVLDSVTDPHNLGACLRTAEAAGVHGVVVPKDNAVSMTPAVRKIASGAAEIVTLYQVTNLARCLRKMQDAGVWIVGAACEVHAKPLFDIDLTGPLALVMGAEGKGMRQLTQQQCDYLVSIPMQGVLDSLNVSVAAGICIFEAVRQRLAK